jgi:hypothetical protein
VMTLLMPFFATHNSCGKLTGMPLPANLFSITQLKFVGRFANRP